MICSMFKLELGGVVYACGKFSKPLHASMRIFTKLSHMWYGQCIAHHICIYTFSRMVTCSIRENCFANAFEWNNFIVTVWLSIGFQLTFLPTAIHFIQTLNASAIVQLSTINRIYVTEQTKTNKINIYWHLNDGDQPTTNIQTITKYINHIMLSTVFFFLSFSLYGWISCYGVLSQ